MDRAGKVPLAIAVFIFLQSAAQASGGDDVLVSEAGEMRFSGIPSYASTHYIMRLHSDREPRKVPFPPGISEDQLKALVQRIASSQGVAFAERDPIMHAEALPNDIFLGQLWQLEQISAPAAWELHTGSQDVRVCIPDSGIDFFHPDLSGNVDINGSVLGTTFGNGTRNPNQPGLDDYGHGSHCAGIIGAVGNNSAGVAGVSWRVGLMSCKFIDDTGAGATSDCARCVRWCVDNNASVISISSSSGFYGSSTAMEEAIQHALNYRVLIVTAAGNQYSSIPSYPSAYSASYSNVISVGATGEDDALALFSNWGPSWVLIGAPGTGVLSTWMSPYYASRSGTSTAAPLVAGAAALALAAAGGPKSIEPGTLRDYMLLSADRVPELADKVRCGGRLNVSALLQLVVNASLS